MKRAACPRKAGTTEKLCVNSIEIRYSVQQAYARLARSAKDDRVC